ncbi:hypothetical protein GC170_09835 [bacterium]|nr:hypothetical protein [bacterium]
MGNSGETNSTHRAGKFVSWIGPPILVIFFMTSLSKGLIPAGVPGEWTWNAPATAITVLEVIPAIITLTTLIVFSMIGERFLESRPKRAIVVLSLFPLTAAVQAGWQMAAPQGYGLAKWPIATYNPGSSGYFAKARDEIGDVSDFLRQYPEWIKNQDVLHTGTHPPGLFVEARRILNFWNSHPAEAGAFMAWMPGELREAAKAAKPGGTPVVEQASVVTLALVRWLASALTVWPIWLIMRRLERTPLTSFRTALLWGVVPSSVLFQPASDLLFPVLACSAVAMSLTASATPGLRNRVIDPVLAGIVLAIGMYFSLVFLAVGALVALVVLADDHSKGLRIKCTRIGWIGFGFLVGTLAWAVAGRTDPLAIWLANQAKHAGFYKAYPRSYWPWLLADFIESAAGLGLPAALSFAITLSQAIFRRSGLYRHRVALASIAILAILAISGRSLSEVGRLWLPFFPFLLTSALPDYQMPRESSLDYRWILIWSAVQIFWLQALVQCVYPI